MPGIQEITDKAKLPLPAEGQTYTNELYSQSQVAVREQLVDIYAEVTRIGGDEIASFFGDLPYRQALAGGRTADAQKIQTDITTLLSTAIELTNKLLDINIPAHNISQIQQRNYLLIDVVNNVTKYLALVDSVSTPALLAAPPELPIQVVIDHVNQLRNKLSLPENAFAHLNMSESPSIQTIKKDNWVLKNREKGVVTPSTPDSFAAETLRGRGQQFLNGRRYAIEYTELGIVERKLFIDALTSAIPAILGITDLTSLHDNYTQVINGLLKFRLNVDLIERNISFDSKPCYLSVDKATAGGNPSVVSVERDFTIQAFDKIFGGKGPKYSIPGTIKVTFEWGAEGPQVKEISSDSVAISALLFADAGVSFSQVLFLALLEKVAPDFLHAQWKQYTATSTDIKLSAFVKSLLPKTDKEVAAFATKFNEWADNPIASIFSNLRMQNYFTEATHNQQLVALFNLTTTPASLQDIANNIKNPQQLQLFIGLFTFLSTRSPSGDLLPLAIAYLDTINAIPNTPPGLNPAALEQYKTTVRNDIQKLLAPRIEQIVKEVPGIKKAYLPFIMTQNQGLSTDSITILNNAINAATNDLEAFKKSVSTNPDIINIWLAEMNKALSAALPPDVATTARTYLKTQLDATSATTQRTKWDVLNAIVNPQVTAAPVVAAAGSAASTTTAAAAATGPAAAAASTTTAASATAAAAAATSAVAGVVAPTQASTFSAEELRNFAKVDDLVTASLDKMRAAITANKLSDNENSLITLCIAEISAWIADKLTGYNELLTMLKLEADLGAHSDEFNTLVDGLIKDKNDCLDSFEPIQSALPATAPFATELTDLNTQVTALNNKLWGDGTTPGSIDLKFGNLYEILGHYVTWRNDIANLPPHIGVLVGTGEVLEKIIANNYFIPPTLWEHLVSLQAEVTAKCDAATVAGTPIPTDVQQVNDNLDNVISKGPGAPTSPALPFNLTKSLYQSISAKQQDAAFLNGAGNPEFSDAAILRAVNGPTFGSAAKNNIVHQQNDALLLFKKERPFYDVIVNDTGISISFSRIFRSALDNTSMAIALSGAVNITTARSLGIERDTTLNPVDRAEETEVIETFYNHNIALLTQFNSSNANLVFTSAADQAQRPLPATVAQLISEAADFAELQMRQPVDAMSDDEKALVNFFITECKGMSLNINTFNKLLTILNLEAKTSTQPTTRFTNLVDALIKRKNAYLSNPQPTAALDPTIQQEVDSLTTRLANLNNTFWGIEANISTKTPKVPGIIEQGLGVKYTIAENYEKWRNAEDANGVKIHTPAYIQSLITSGVLQEIIKNQEHLPATLLQHLSLLKKDIEDQWENINTAQADVQQAAKDLATILEMNASYTKTLSSINYEALYQSVSQRKQDMAILAAVTTPDPNYSDAVLLHEMNKPELENTLNNDALLTPLTGGGAGRMFIEELVYGVVKNDLDQELNYAFELASQLSLIASSFTKLQKNNFTDIRLKMMYNDIASIAHMLDTTQTWTQNTLKGIAALFKQIPFPKKDILEECYNDALIIVKAITVINSDSTNAVLTAIVYALNTEDTVSEIADILETYQKVFAKAVLDHIAGVAGAVLPPLHEYERLQAFLKLVNYNPAALLETDLITDTTIADIAPRAGFAGSAADTYLNKETVKTIANLLGVDLPVGQNTAVELLLAVKLRSHCFTPFQQKLYESVDKLIKDPTNKTEFMEHITTLNKLYKSDDQLASHNPILEKSYNDTKQRVNSIDAHDFTDPVRIHNATNQVLVAIVYALNTDNDVTKIAEILETYQKVFAKAVLAYVDNRSPSTNDTEAMNAALHEYERLQAFLKLVGYNPAALLANDLIKNTTIADITPGANFADSAAATYLNKETVKTIANLLGVDLPVGDGTAVELLLAVKLRSHCFTPFQQKLYVSVDNLIKDPTNATELQRHITTLNDLYEGDDKVVDKIEDKGDPRSYAYKSREDFEDRQIVTRALQKEAQVVADIVADTTRTIPISKDTRIKPSQNTLTRINTSGKPGLGLGEILYGNSGNHILKRIGTAWTWITGKIGDAIAAPFVAIGNAVTGLANAIKSLIVTPPTKPAAPTSQKNPLQQEVENVEVRSGLRQVFDRSLAYALKSKELLEKAKTPSITLAKLTEHITELDTIIERYQWLEEQIIDLNAHAAPNSDAGHACQGTFAKNRREYRALEQEVFELKKRAYKLDNPTIVLDMNQLATKQPNQIQTLVTQLSSQIPAILANTDDVAKLTQIIEFLTQINTTLVSLVNSKDPDAIRLSTTINKAIAENQNKINYYNLISRQKRTYVLENLDTLLDPISKINKIGALSQKKPVTSQIQTEISTDSQALVTALSAKIPATITHDNAAEAAQIIDFLAEIADALDKTKADAALSEQINIKIKNTSQTLFTQLSAQIPTTITHDNATEAAQIIAFLRDIKRTLDKPYVRVLSANATLLGEIDQQIQAVQGKINALPVIIVAAPPTSQQQQPITSGQQTYPFTLFSWMTQQTLPSPPLRPQQQPQPQQQAAGSSSAAQQQHKTTKVKAGGPN